MGGSHKIQNLGLLTATVALVGLFFQNCGKEIVQPSGITGEASSNTQMLAPAPRDPSGYTVCPSQGVFIESQGKTNEFVASGGAKYYCLVNNQETNSLRIYAQFSGTDQICGKFRVAALGNPDLNFPGMLSASGNNIVLNLRDVTKQALPPGVYIIKVEGLDNTCVGKISRYSISWQN